MITSFTNFAEKLQDLFHDITEILSKKTNFFQRIRQIDSMTWLSAVLQWITQQNPTLASLANRLATKDVSISKQALDKKFNMKCVDFLREVLAAVLTLTFTNSNAKAPALLALFNGVYIADCTILQLSQETKEMFPGVGGKDDKVNVSELKIFLRIEATTGNIEHFAYDSSRTSDSKFYQQTNPLPKGALELVDMGFVSHQRMRFNLENGINFICRVQSHSILYYQGVKYSISEFLQQQRENVIDVPVLLGKQKIPTRLVARRVSQEAEQRKMKSVAHTASKLGREVSQAQTIVSKWQFYVTNIDAKVCSVDEIITLYGVRWQIELIFKLWKNNMNLNESNGKTTVRTLCEKLIKMIYLLIFHIHEIHAGIGPVCEISHVEILDRYKLLFPRLIDVLWRKRSVRTICKVINRIVKFILNAPKRNVRNKNPLLYNRLQNRQFSQIKTESS